MGGLSATGLADLAGATEAEVERLVELGILVVRDGTGPFLETDVQKVRLATACEQAGLPMAGIAAAIRAGRLSFAFLEGSPFRRWAVRSTRTYRQVSQETGIPLDTLVAVLDSMGFARMGPEEPMREDELAVVPLLRHGLSSGILDRAWLTRLGRAHVEGLRLITTAWGEAYQARFEGPVLAAGGDQRTAMEEAARKSVGFLPLSDPALLAIYHRQEELLWTEGLVERIEDELEAAGMLGRPGRVPAMSFLDLVGYTHLTEQRGDAAAAALAETLAVLVNRSAREHGGVPVKWLGDGVMIHHREPAGAVRSALGLVDQLPEAGLPPAHVGVAAGPVVVQGGDYFGRTVNLAARIASRAGPGQVLVSQSVADSAPPQGVRFVEQ
ncbi:MAG TPA: adenylate/guanylate cyclase domain-containing protein, partial [Actinomycetes bacterium]|nr:adenylate/guanylate cyclase domain-containing protein [Actinomycetes bacterium]